jgi:hypothetical protein
MSLKAFELINSDLPSSFQMQAKKKKNLVNNHHRIPSTKSQINSNIQNPEVDL